MGNIFGRFNKFEKELPNVEGKVFVITGTTSGTGYIAAETVAKHGGEVLLLNRASSRSVSSYEKLLKANAAASSGGRQCGKIIPIECDLQDFQSVQKACDKIKSLGYTEIYCLSNNAGIMAMDDTMTQSDGYEIQMQTNHLSHFLLTTELFPLLLAGSKKYGDARIVQHSSAARLMTEHNTLEEKYFQKQTKNGQLGGNETSGMMKGGPFFRYQQTKLANSVFTHALHEKLQASNNVDCQNIKATCAHPGIAQSNLGEHLYTESNFIVRKFVMPMFIFCIAQSAEDGSMGLLRGMMDSKTQIESGVLYGPSLKLPKSQRFSGLAVANPPTPCEIDSQSKTMLWDLSEKAIGRKFIIP